jgi:2-(1,2-epoxy-1,2-dihydrophenyl)acetyl-CoA isomerase
MKPMSYHYLLVETSPEGVRTITLNRPEKLNAVNQALAAEVPRALREAGSDESVRCVVLTGAGRGFCAGLELDPANVAAMRTITNRTQQVENYGWVGWWAQAVTSCPVPVIAAINGPCAGAGFGLTLACDIRLVSDAAVMTAGYARIGLSPDAGVSYFLPRLIGTARATELILTARDLKADEAERIGLAAAIYPAAEFAARAHEYATRLAQGPTIALIHTKRLLNQTLDSDMNTQLRGEWYLIRECFQTQDHVEAVKAFREKRKPAFAGR